MPDHALRFGMLTMPYPPWPRLLVTWREYEAMGFDSVWVCDHFVSASGQRPLFEAWTLLAALAAETERLRLGTAASCNAFRQTALLAKEIVTVDHISNGRLDVGLGAGWWAAEHEMYGFAFLPPPARIDRFRETVAVLDRLLRGDVTTHDGDALRLREAICRPTPVQRPRPPLVLAAQGAKMLRTIAPFVDTWMASFGLSPAEVADRNRALDARCIEIGRDPRQVRRAFPWAPWVQPRGDREVPHWQRALHRAVPPTQTLARAGVYASHEAVAGAMLGNRALQRVAEAACMRHLRSQVADPVLRAACVRLRPDLPLHECPVGQRSAWKNVADHPYRLHPALRLARIPTLIRFAGGCEIGRLVEADCGNAAAVEAFLK